MACDVYQKLDRERKLALDEQAIWVYPQNAHLSAGVSQTKRRELTKGADEKIKRLSDQMYRHRQTCPVCKDPAAPVSHNG